MKSMLFALALLLAHAAANAQQPANIVPNENLVLDGLPPIPAGIAETVGRYTEFRAASFAAWHPTKREMLISTRFGDTSQLHWVRAPGADRRQITFSREPVTSAAFPRTDLGYFVFTRDKGGDEFRQLYRFDVTTGEITLVSDGKRSQNGLGVFSRSGLVAFGSTARNGADRDIYVVDPKQPESRRLLLEVQGGGWGPLDFSPDGSRLLVGEYVSVVESHFWMVDSNTGAKTLVTPPKGGPKVAWGGGEFSADGKSVYVTTDKDSEFQRLGRLDLATGALDLLTPGLNWDVEGFDLSPDGRNLAFVTNEDGISVLHFLDAATGKEKPVPKLPIGVIGSIAWHENSRDLALDLSEARAPYDVYSVDAATGKVDRWTESETAGFPAGSFATAELVRWPTFDGRTLSGFLYKPATKWTGRRPVIVNIHGGPEGQDRPDFLGRSNFYTNELGIAIIFPNVRGSTGFGKSFVALDDGVKREDSVKDIGALLDWIRSRPDLDADRVMITGGSYGGYMTLASAVHFSDRVRCFVDVVGVSNFVTFLQNTEAYRRDLRRVEYGDERDPRMRAFLEGIAPVNRADRITKPMFVVQGKNDPRVPISESEQIVAALKKRGVPVWYLVATDEGHGFKKKRNIDFQFYATVAFVQEHLLK
ncbi:MAG TPA: S9 family peptidase [Vicinamibacteria bacterium]|nr:S9 family peptidase [Vicinamibacteria bacterium]